MLCRLMLIALVMGSAASLTRAQTNDPVAIRKTIGPYFLDATSDRKDAMFHLGEEATFTFTLTKNKEPAPGEKIKWALTKDGVTPSIKTGDATTDDKGQFAIKGTLNEPGFLQCRADFTAPDCRIPTARAAGAFEPEKIKPSMPVPDDFDAYWADQWKQVNACPPNVRLTPVKSPLPDIEVFDLQADCAGGLTLSAYLARPIGAANKSLPAILLLQGAGVASSRLSWTAQWAHEGFVAMDFNVHGLPNGKPQSWYSALYRTDLKQYYLQGRDSRDDMFFHKMLIRLMTAANVLLSQPQWNGDQFVAYGRSQGGGQAIAAGGLDPRVTFIAAQIPALCDQTGFVVGRINGWPKLVTFTDGKPDEKTLQAARYYDAMNFATRTKADAFFTVGFIDVSCPPSGVYATYNLIKGKKSILTFPLTGHRATAAGDDGSRAAILKYVKGTAP